MKNLLTILIVVLAFVVSGCSMLEPLQDKSADKIASLVEKYCAETDPVFRAQYRERINRKLNGRRIEVTCEN